MKKIAIFLFILIICCSFVGFFFNNSGDDEMPLKDQIALKVINETAKTIEKKYKLHPIGTAMSGMDKFRSLGIQFETEGLLSKEQARVLLIACVQELLKNINSNEEIKPLLINNPFTHENVSFTLFIRDKNNNKLYHPNISVAALGSCGLEFITNDPDNEFKYKEKCQETYEEAYQLVHRNE